MVSGNLSARFYPQWQQQQPYWSGLKDTLPPQKDKDIGKFLAQTWAVRRDSGVEEPIFSRAIAPPIRIGIRNPSHFEQVWKFRYGEDSYRDKHIILGHLMISQYDWGTEGRNLKSVEEYLDKNLAAAHNPCFAVTKIERAALAEKHSYKWANKPYDFEKETPILTIECEDVACQAGSSVDKKCSHSWNIKLIALPNGNGYIGTLKDKCSQPILFPNQGYNKTHQLLLQPLKSSGNDTPPEKEGDDHEPKTVPLQPEDTSLPQQ
jgi:hypothetical protein